MGLFIDLGASNARLSEPEFEAWAAEHTAFISSEMTDLRAEREAVAEALRTAGLQVVFFEDLGGRDEDAQSAYLEGVARSDIYVGIVGDRYGSMLSSGRSPTHEEYRYARERGKRISFWVARDGAKRQGDARDFVSGVQVFHTTGGYTTADDLARRVLERLKEIAADDEAPWVKVGDAVFRALRIHDQGDRVQIAAKSGTATSRDTWSTFGPERGREAKRSRSRFRTTAVTLVSSRSRSRRRLAPPGRS